MLQIKNLDTTIIDSSNLEYSRRPQVLSNSNVPSSMISRIKPSKINIETLEKTLIEKTAKTNKKLAQQIEAAVLGKDALELEHILQSTTPDVRKTLVNTSNEKGFTPLLHCALAGGTKCMHLLLNAGADPLCTNSEKSNFVHLAIKHNHSGMLEIFLERLSKDTRFSKDAIEPLIHARDKLGLTPLLLSCLCENIHCMNLLLDQGADPSQKDSRLGCNFLHFAALRGRSKMLEAFLQKISKIGGFPKGLCQILVNAKSKQSDTPLLMTTASGSEACMKLLLDAGADPLYAKPSKATFVHLAAGDNQFKMLERFFERLTRDSKYGKTICNALVNAPDCEGYTPLFYCSSKKDGGVESMHLLLARGASPFHRTFEGNNFVHKTAATGRSALLEAFLQRLSESRLGNYRCKALVHTRNREGITPLIACGLSGDRACLDLLLGAGAKLLDVSASGITAYSYALYKNQTLLAQYTLQKEPRLEGIFALNVLGHVFGFEPGEARLPGFSGKRFLLGGAPSHLMHNLIVTDLEKPGVREKFFSLCKKSQYEELVTAFARSCMYDENFPIEEIIKDIGTGRLVILRSGWQNHGITLVFRDGYLVICNRGEGSESERGLRRTFFVRKINSIKLTTKILEKILTSGNLSKEEMVEFFYTKLPKILQGKQDAFCRKIMLSNTSPNYSKSGVCAYASGKAALRAALVLLTKDKRKGSLKNAKNAAKHWAVHHRQWALESFKTSPSPFTEAFKEGIVRICSANLAKHEQRLASL